ncbi:MAG: hypothetical protein ACW98K_05400 [Candidatus Kariarchaeaceae archaeon]|jgi:DNA-binding NarL/FixJ family response regulator
MEPNPDDILSDEIESLFKEDETQEEIREFTNILIVGPRNTFKRFNGILEKTTEYKLSHVNNIDDSIALLLVDIFGIVIIDNDDPTIDTITISRLVRINHPLARIIVISKRRGSALISDIINQGSVDAFLTYPLYDAEVQKLVAEQQARHEITKMLTNFVSQPPKLSKASYLLLDPSLTFKENEPVKFVGIMFAYKSVPRFSRFFEDVLTKDDILFSGYLSGVAMLGKELFTNKEPLKEINFGGVSVIFRFHEEIQFSIFVRNLTRHNYKRTEDIIGDVIEDILTINRTEIEELDILPKKTFNSINRIVNGLEKANEEIYIQMPPESSLKQKQAILILGSDMSLQQKIANFIEKKIDNEVILVDDEEEVSDYLRTHDFGVLLLDSKLKKENPLTFAEYIKETSPAIQVVYQVRDRRASRPLINALNSGLIDQILPYRAPFRDITRCVKKRLDKAREIKERSLTGEGIEQTLDQATIARTIIRDKPELYIPEEIPELHGIFISRDVQPIFQIFWRSSLDEKIEFDQEILAGLVASLDNVGEEMFADHESVGKLELGGANILVSHRADYNFAYFVKNIDPNTSIVVTKEIELGTNRLYQAITEASSPVDSPEVNAVIDTIANQIYSGFSEKFLA